MAKGIDLVLIEECGYHMGDELLVPGNEMYEPRSIGDVVDDHGDVFDDSWGVVF